MFEKSLLKHNFYIGFQQQQQQVKFFLHQQLVAITFFQVTNNLINIDNNQSMMFPSTRLSSSPLFINKCLITITLIVISISMVNSQCKLGKMNDGF